MKQFRFIKADQFFAAYAPRVKSYKHKIRGRNGRDNPVEFSDDDKKEIKRGMKKMARDLLNMKL
jgi:hypothetical protein